MAMLARDIETRLAAAATACERQGARLTDLRRETLSLILAADAPMGAYDLLERLRHSRGRAAPPTVYRALDFLLAQGLVHRVERLNAFVGCPEPGGHAHPAQFLICGRCGMVAELDDAEVSAAVAQAAADRGFRPDRTTIEVEGTCAACAAA